MEEIQVQYPDEFNKLDEQFNYSQQVACGPECRRSRRDRQLYRDVEQAEFNNRIAEITLQLARRNFITETKGPAEWNEMIQKEAEDDTEKVINEYKNEFNNIYEDASQLANSVNVQLNSLNQLKSVENQYSTDIRNMNEVSGEILNTKNTNMRYADFNSQSIQTVNLWRGYLSYLYWFIVVIYSVVVMIIGQQFRYYRGWIFLVFLISYPYISQYLASWIPSSWFINVNVNQPDV